MIELTLFITTYATTIITILSVLLAVSEGLPLTKKIKANNTVSLALNVFKTITKSVKRK